MSYLGLLRLERILIGMVTIGVIFAKITTTIMKEHHRTKETKMFAIKIDKASLPLISALNNGTVPEIETEATYFVYENEDVVPYIINEEAYWELCDDREIFVAPIKVNYFRPV